MSSQTMSNSEAAVFLGYSRQHFEALKKKYPGYPEYVGTLRPRVTRKDGSQYNGTPYPVFKKDAFMKWVKDNGIKRKGDDDNLSSISSFNAMAQMFIRRPRIDA
jgi:hypothetical protein